MYEFTSEQRGALDQAFLVTPQMDSDGARELSEITGLTVKQVIEHKDGLRILSTRKNHKKKKPKQLNYSSFQVFLKQKTMAEFHSS